MATKLKAKSAKLIHAGGSSASGRASTGTGNMDWSASQPWAEAALPGARASLTAPAIMQRNGREVAGEDMLALARRHIGEAYAFGARAPMANPNWRGPWDCAEFVSWCLYQSTGILFGTEPRNDPLRADAYTGFWAQQARAARCTIPLADAVATAGAVLLRYPQPGAIGHIAFSDGNGGTLEAHSRKLGVIAGTASGRRWDTGVLAPGIRYFRTGDGIAILPPAGVIRLTNPLTKSARVEQIQHRLEELGYAPGTIDGVYGPQTAAAVRQFQIDEELVVDGEVGLATLKALKL